MSWKLDAIDFEDYGVIVSKSSGVLDLQSIADVSLNWLDENGMEYWQDIADVKYEDTDIILSCWILANNYADFKTKVADFFSALTSAGVRSLETPFGNLIDVNLHDSVPVTRITSYLRNIQAGMFSLRLKVSGDSKTKLITIYEPDETPRLVVKYGSDAKISRSLMGDSSISFQVEFNAIQSLGRGLHVYYEGEKYVHLGYPEISKISTNKIVYRLTFTHEFFYLKDVMFRVIDNSYTPLWATMEDIVDLIITNAERGYPGLFVKGTIEATENRNHQFQDESSFTVLDRVAREYELEWEYKQNVTTGVITINVVKTVGTATAITFTYGKDNNLYKLNRVPSPREDLCTVLWAYGSEKNIPASYGYPRLKLSAPLTFPFYDMVMERTKVFDDIFPERTGIVTGYLKTEKAATWVYAPGTYPLNPIKIYTYYPDENTYELTDTSMPFDLMEKDANGNTVYLISGTSAKIHFNSGDLAGFEFEVLDYDHTTFTFKLIPYKDEAGNVYPSDTLFPTAGDEYKILDINIPQSYIDTAEAALLSAATTWLNNLMGRNADYEVETTPDSDLTIFPGDTVQLVDTDFSINAEMRIIDIVTNMYGGGSFVKLSDAPSRSKRQDLTLKVESLERSIKTANLDEVETRRASEKTTGELKNTLIDPIDEKLKADMVVRRKSLDPVMLAEDAKTIQYSLSGALVTPNIGGNANSLTIDAGIFLNHSFYAVDRETIKIIKAI